MVKLPQSFLMRKRSSSGGVSRPSNGLMFWVCGLLLTVALHVWLNHSAPQQQPLQEQGRTWVKGSRLDQRAIRPFKPVSRTFLTAASEAESWSVGACRMHAPLLPMPAITCEPLYCLRSPLYPSTYVDVWFKALTPTNDSIMRQSCSDAVGGQVGHGPTKSVQVSFIITFRDNVRTTMQCLLELFRTAREALSVEFIMVDDGSTADTSNIKEMGRRITHFFAVPFRVLRNAHPLGHGAAYMLGVQKAAGTYVVLLRSDVFVTPGWLFSLLRTFETVPKVGIAGALLVSSKGAIMEAGGIVYADGSAANYGRNEQPDHRHMYSRGVDYISATCIMVKRTAFLEAQGFDPAYQSDYYGDTDLAQAITRLGYRVQYQPLAVVIHDDVGSLASDEAARMQANQDIFTQKWHDSLNSHFCKSSLPSDTAALRLAGTKRVLWIDDIVPEPDKDSGSIRTNNLLTLLRGMGFAVSYQPMSPRDEKYTAQARFNGIQVLPFSHPRDYKLQRDGQCLYDFVFVARVYIYRSVAALLQNSCRFTPVIFDTVDLHFLREARMALSSNRRWNFDSTDVEHVATWLESDDPRAKSVAATRDKELTLVRASRVTVVVSEQEARLLNRVAPGAVVKVLSNVHVVDRHQRPPENCSIRRGILFVGNFNHMPNQQAMEALVQDVLPQLYKSLPVGKKQSIVLHIVGSNRSPTTCLRGTPITTIFHGWLSDQQLRLLYSTVKVVVAPLMSGAGVKGKINQAMLYGVPVVATPVAAEGMHLVDGENAMIATTANEFAQKLLEVYTDCRIWERIVQGGLDNVREFYSMQAADTALKAVLSEVQMMPLASGSRCH